MLLADELLLSGPQQAELATVLATSEFTSLAGSYAIARALIGPAEQMESEANLRNLARLAFRQISVRAVGQVEWIESSDLVWMELIEPSFAWVTPGQLLRALTAQQQTAIDKTLASGEQSGLPRFVRQSLTALGNAQSLRALCALSHDICAAVPHTFGTLKLRHISGDRRPAGLEESASELYIERLLHPLAGHALASSRENGDLDYADLTAQSFPALRAVVVGDPGVGKSTLVERTATQLASDGRYAPLVLRCRDLNGSADQSLMESMSDSLRKDLAVTDASVESVEHLCALGKAFVIFDGLDEITTSLERQETATRIRLFCSTYPTTPVMVTARKIGYSADWLDHRSFAKLGLEEFSEAQVAEYANTWFRRVAGRVELAAPFLSEVTSLGEIKNNPLILSLICSVYVDQGYIPRNRREIYRECSLLLMRKWDSQRQIHVPFDHLEYGMKIMRDLGDFFSKNAKNRGVEERQLRSLLTTFFTQTAGVDHDVAADRAQDFLDYCADRTWLLSRVGTNQAGDRLFGFTHQTFREYFEAEALVRRQKDPEKVALHLYETYRQNPSSVMPELIMQAFDEVNEGELGALPRRLLRLQGVNLSPIRLEGYALLLRLINSSPVGASVMDEVLNAYLSGQTKRTSAEATAFFDLYRDPRGRALRAADAQPKSVMRELSREYASLVLTGRRPQVEDPWYGPLGRQYDSSGPAPILWKHLELDIGALSVDSLRSGPRAAVDRALTSLLISEDVWGNSYSILMRCLSRLASPINKQEHDESLLAELLEVGVQTYRLPERAMSQLVAESEETIAGWDNQHIAQFRAVFLDQQSVRDCVVWLAAAAYETDPTRIARTQILFDAAVGGQVWRDAIRVGIEDEAMIDAIRQGRDVGDQLKSLLVHTSPRVGTAWLRGATFVNFKTGGGVLRQRRNIAAP
ncbi:NACHT domain-containing protein [Aquipuribacter sp. MA13-6]|uniref:NACHT domain-containing protein n=1 Tax=unclassified Aquipuribacter TaxID=2635084 RepID=UPI003EEB9B7E